MELIELGVYGLSGAVGVVVAALVVRNREKREAFAGLTVAVGILTTALLMGPAKSWNAARITDKELGALKMYRALKKAEPQTYEKVREAMINGIKAGKNSSAVVEEMAPLMSELVPKYLVKTTDPAAVGFLAALNGGLTELISGGGDDCYHWMYPGKGKVSTAAVNRLSRKAKEGMAEAMGEVLVQAMENPQPAPDAAAGDEAIKRVVENIGEQGHLDGLLLTEMQGLNSAQRREVCLASQALFLELLKLPEGQRGLAIRHNFSGK